MSLQRRLDRVSQGIVNSAVDEFISKRIPVQFGGMSDPFMPLEIKTKATKKAIQALNSQFYPAVFSTKSTLPARREYLPLIKDGNFYVRFSLSASNETKTTIEPGVPKDGHIFRAIERLSSAGVPVCIRIQPLFPGAEARAKELIKRASNSGAIFVSLEYLKIPREHSTSLSKRMDQIFDGNSIEHFKSLNGEYNGREIILPTSYKAAHLLDLKRFANKLGMLVGIAENEFLHFSDGETCCNGATRFLKDAKNHESTIPFALRQITPGEQLRFTLLKDLWRPKFQIGQYLNSRSRVQKGDGGSDFHQFISSYWNGSRGLFSPDFFYGISDTGKVDTEGMKIFKREATQFDSLTQS